MPLGKDGYMNILRKNMWEYAIGKEGYINILKKKICWEWEYAIGERWIHEYFGEKYAIGTEGYMIILKKNLLGICHWGKWAKYPGPTIVGKISKPDNIIANLWNEQFFRNSRCLCVQFCCTLSLSLSLSIRHIIIHLSRTCEPRQH